MGEVHNAIQGSSPPRTSDRLATGLYSSTQGGIGVGAGGAIPNLEEELTLDKTTLETLKALYSAKERAVQMEDFDEAKRIKETIERLKTVSTQIS